MTHNRRMSERVELPEDTFPPEVISLHTAIAGRARLVILQHLLAHPGVTFNDLVDVLDMSGPMIRASIAQLRDLGYVVDERAGRSKRLTVDRRRLADDLGALTSVLLGA